MAFYVGQRVVCVDAAPERPDLNMGTLRQGEVYTIRWVGSYHTRACVRVVEIVRPCGPDKEKRDTPYLVRRFRPLVERKTDISIFKRLLIPSNLEREEA